MNSFRRHRPLLLLVAGATALALTGCTATVVEASQTRSPESQPTVATAAGDGPTVPGYDVGQFPPVPLFQLPDLALLDRSASAFTIDLTARIGTHPGLTVAPAHCDSAGAVTSGAGTAYLYGDGSGNYTGPDGTVQNFGDGSGNTTINGVTIQNFGDGSGNYSDGTVTIQNFGDGSGNYSDARITIQNFGDGTGTVDGKPVKVAPIADVPRLGVFPPLGALAPIASCGTTITLADGVLFDFDRSDVRADAAQVLDSLAQALAAVAAPQAIVSGHTDAIGSDSYNQQLSERRADAVVAALRERGVGGDLTARGFGESRPVAANEVNGADNPAGRQLNRRVEIFVPAFGA